VIAQDPVFLRPQPRNSRSRLTVHEVGPELDGDSLQRVERMREQEQLGFGVDCGALHAFCIPGVADFKPPMRRFNIHITRAADYVTRRRVDDRERLRAL